MTRWQLALLATVLVAAAGLGAWAWFGSPREEQAVHPSTGERFVPLHRERCILVVGKEPEPPDVDPRRIIWRAHGVPSSPDGDTRRRFDGRWTGESDSGPVTVLLLDGVGDLIVGPGEERTVWGFQVFEYSGDDYIRIEVWPGDEYGTAGIAAYMDEAGSILVKQIQGVRHYREFVGLPREPFALYRDRSVGDVDFGALSRAHPVHPPWPADPAPPVKGEHETEPVPKPGRYLLLLTMDQGLLGVLDEQQIFRGEQLYSIGTAYSGAPVLKRRHVKEIIWPDGVDPAKYPAKKE